MMHDAFISYSTKDLTRAQYVRDMLEKNGVPCWMAPRDIPGGSNYTKEIPVAIRNCRVFVLILSQSAQNSQWVLKELDSAVNNGKVILPFMLEEFELSDEFNFLLSGTQRYSAYPKESEALEALITRIHAIVKPQNMAAVEPTIESSDKAAEVRQPVTYKAVEGGRTSKCPACGSINIKELAPKMGVFGVKERISRILVPILALVIGYITMEVGFMIGSFLISDVGVIVFFGLVSFVWGTILGVVIMKRIVDERVRRRRVRAHLSQYLMCCSECKKKFLLSEDN